MGKGEGGDIDREGKEGGRGHSWSLRGEGHDREIGGGGEVIGR